MGLLTEVLHFGRSILPGEPPKTLDDIKAVEECATATEMLLSDTGLAWTRMANNNTVIIGEVITNKGRVVSHQSWFIVRNRKGRLEIEVAPTDGAEITLDVFANSQPETPLTQSIANHNQQFEPINIGDGQFGKLRYETREPNLGPEATFIIDQQGIRPFASEKPVREVEEIGGRDTHIIKSILAEPSST
ncbi:hypothetical protein HY383_03965 [Candidatus Daviesbacteria bacterium]|nr:hypothetical protein [Candidatus Daviesbacteria bacterium]